MVHGDNRGLVIPPKIAPTQVMIVPVAQHREGVLDKAYDVREEISKYARVDIDASDHMPGWKFNESEMKGYPVRLEIGPRDIENEQVDRKSTRLNSSHVAISYAVFCLKKKKINEYLSCSWTRSRR